MDKLAYSHAHDIRDTIKSKKISAVELTKHFLERIDKYNDEIKAYSYVCADRALQDAEQVDKWVSEGKTDLPLLGIPMIVDGGIYLKGGNQCYGSTVSVEEISKFDAPDVQFLREKGAIILGNGNCAEFGLTATTINNITEQTRNPLNKSYSTGGASGGVSAALAKGLATLGIGPDRSGGARLPASYCGLTSIKPTRGRVPIVRDFPMSIVSKAITQVCPIAKCSEDLGLLLSTLSHEDAGDPDRLRTCALDFENLQGELQKDLRIGWLPRLGDIPVDDEIAEVTLRGISLLERQGYPVEEVRVDIDISLFKHFCNVFSCEHYVPIVSICEMNPQGCSCELMRGTHRWLNYAKTVTGIGLAMGNSQLNIIRQKFNRLFDEYDLLLLPATPMGPNLLDEIREEDLVDGCFDYTLKAWAHLFPFNMSGHPSMVIPGGVSTSGVSIGINAVAKYCDEALLLQFSKSVENAFKLQGKSPILTE